MVDPESTKATETQEGLGFKEGLALWDSKSKALPRPASGKPQDPHSQPDTARQLWLVTKLKE